MTLLALDAVGNAELWLVELIEEDPLLEADCEREVLDADAAEAGVELALPVLSEAVLDELDVTVPLEPVEVIFVLAVPLDDGADEAVAAELSCAESVLDVSPAEVADVSVPAGAMPSLLEVAAAVDVGVAGTSSDDVAEADAYVDSERVGTLWKVEESVEDSVDESDDESEEV